MYLPLYMVVFIVSGRVHALCSDRTRVQLCLVRWHFSKIVFLHVWAAQSLSSAPVINHFEWNSGPCNIQMYLVLPAVTTAVAKSTGRGSLQTINFKFLNQIISLCLQSFFFSVVPSVFLVCFFFICLQLTVLMALFFYCLQWEASFDFHCLHSVFWPHVLLSESRSLCAVWQLIPPRPR